MSCSYTAPVIPGSQLPPLLGLKSLTAKKVVLDMHGKVLVLPGEGGIEIRCSPGTRVLQLETSESEHLLLPLHSKNVRTVDASSTLIESSRVDFNVRCREARTPSPVRKSVRRFESSPYDRDVEVLQTGKAKSGIGVWFHSSC